VICFLVLSLKEIFLHYSDGTRVQTKVIILINTFKGKGVIASRSLYIVKLSQFSALEFFVREPEAQVENKIL